MGRSFLLGLVLTSVGFALVFVRAALSTVGSGNVSTGGVVFIGPVPIVFGSGPAGTDLALGSVLIAAVMVAIFLLMGRRGTGE